MGILKQAYCLLYTLNLEDVSLMLGLNRLTTNVGPIYKLKNPGFLGLVSSR